LAALLGKLRFFTLLSPKEVSSIRDLTLDEIDLALKDPELIALSTAALGVSHGQVLRRLPSDLGRRFVNRLFRGISQSSTGIERSTAETRLLLCPGWSALWGSHAPARGRGR
jgi:hypothetical protein